jgi:hypothetical protein
MGFQIIAVVWELPLVRAFLLVGPKLSAGV